MPTTVVYPPDEVKQPTPELDEPALGARVDEIVNRHAAVGLAVGVVRDGRLSFFRGHGLADIAAGTPVTEDTAFRIASITKTMTAIALMQLWERGLVDLDAPADAYLRAFRLRPARPGFRPATLRHLMTHTAGLGEVVPPWGALRPDWGETVPLGRRLPSLAEHYRGRLRYAAEPGTRFAYGNHSPATVAQVVEDVSGEPLDRYFRDHIFEPLGMADSDLRRSDRVASRLAMGYDLGPRGPKAVPPREYVTAGAASVCSTPRDMARYVAALLGGGANGHGRILEPATLATMFEPHWRPDPRLAGMGLAFFRVDLGGHRAVEHQGVMPGFNSQIFLAPDDGTGVIAFTNGAKDAAFWLTAESAGLLGWLVGAPPDAIRHDLPQRPEVWADLCGWYKLDAGLTDVRLRGFMGAGAEVFVRGGQLTMRLLTPVPALYAGFTLHPDDDRDPYVFRIDLAGVGTMRVVFNGAPGAAATSVAIDLMPISLPRQPDRTNPRVRATRGLGALGVAAAAVVLLRRRGARDGRA